MTDETPASRDVRTVPSFAFSALAALLVFPALPQAAEVQGSWEDYCGGENGEVLAASSEKPQPNYNNRLVRDAANKLHEIENIEVRGRHGDVVYNDGRRIYQTKYAKDGGYISSAFWTYPAFEQAYDLCAKEKKNECAEKYAYTVNLLTITCGEYRDNPRMLRKKLEWYKSIGIPTEEDQRYDAGQNVWSQITSRGYRDLLSLSASLYQYRYKQMATDGENPPNLCPVDYSRLDEKSVPATTICEYKYIFSEYLSRQKALESVADFDAYQSGFAVWKTDLKNCEAEDHLYYYEFHADGAMKPQALESNGMIWGALNFAESCRYEPENRTFTTRSSSSSMSDEACNAYFRQPYASRKETDQQGLMRLMFNPASAQGLNIDEIMNHYGSKDINTYGTEPDADLVFVTEDINGDGFAEMLILDPAKKKTCTEPGDADQHSKNGVCRMLWARQNQANSQIIDLGLVAAEKTIDAACHSPESSGMKAGCRVYLGAIAEAKSKLAGVDVSGIHLITEIHEGWKKEFLNRKDKGLSQVFKTKEETWDRLKTVFDRHTQWYLIDMLNLQTAYRKPAYSPWMASSYYIDESASFASPGYAMGLQLDPGRLQWMYVEKVAVNRWFRAQDLDRAWPPAEGELDLLNTWFDETTFSQSLLGASERGWDRFAMAEPEEMAAIFWLYETTPPKGFQPTVPPKSNCKNPDGSQAN